jgi:chemotaxis protein histidine kinase CheA
LAITNGLEEVQVDEITTKLDNLTELSDEEIGGLESEIVGQFDTFDNADALTSESVDAMTELANALETVRGEVARREAEAEELTARKAELSSRVHGKSEPADPEAEESDKDTKDEEEDKDKKPFTASAEAETEASVSDETITPAVETEASVAETVVEAPAATEAAVEEVATTEASAADEATVVESAPEAEAAVVEVPEAPVDPATEASVEVVETASEEVVPEAEASAEEAAEATAEAPIEAEASITEIEPEAQEEALTVTATAGDITVPADRLPIVEEVAAPTVAITAGADLPGVGAGQPIKSMNDVARLMSDRVHSLRRVNGGDGEQVIVASLNAPYTEDRILEGTPEENWAKVTEAKNSNTLVASGGFGTPVETRYDIFGFGTDARPVKDSLPKFQANRGGVRFVKPPVLSSYAGATGVWTEADDIAAASNNGTGTDTFKNELTVAGATEAIAMTDAITLQLKFGNLLSRAYPELVARHNELALIQHAREAELNLLAKINAASTQVTTTSVIGFARDFLVNVRRAAAAYRSRHRISPDTQLQAIIPLWVIDAMAADLALNMPGDDNISVAKAEINGWLANLNVSLTASYDQNTFGAQGTGALLEFPDTFTWFLFSEGSFLFLDGGTLDIGLVRDSSLVSTNDYKMFIETFEGLAFVGIESLAITSTIAVNGAASALVTGVDY